MKYNHYDIEDFLSDTDFIDWVKGRSAENEQFFQKWLKTNPANKEKAILAREILQGFKAEYLQPQEDEYEEVLNNLLKFRNQRIDTPTRIIKSPNLVWRWAAIILIVFSFSFVLHAIWEKSDESPVTSKVEWITKNNPKGQKSQIHLPDGSLVFLNADSEIRYSTAFGISNREIELTGEAFFEVKKNRELPFVVQSENIYTTALGTSFNVTAWKEWDKVSVALIEGKVEVKDAINPEIRKVTLNPGEKIVHQQNEFIKMTYRDDDIAWKDGQIIFENASLAEITQTLERWYGVSIFIGNDPLENVSYSGKFKNTSLEVVLERMAYTERFSYKIWNDSVTLKFNAYD